MPVPYHVAQKVSNERYFQRSERKANIPRNFVHNITKIKVAQILIEYWGTISRMKLILNEILDKNFGYVLLLFSKRAQYIDLPTKIDTKMIAQQSEQQK